MKQKYRYFGSFSHRSTVEDCSVRSLSQWAEYSYQISPNWEFINWIINRLSLVSCFLRMKCSFLFVNQINWFVKKNWLKRMYSSFILSSTQTQWVCLHRQIFINLNESNLISDSQSSVYMNTNLCNQGRTGAKKRPWTFFFFLNESVLSLIRIFIIVSLLKYSKYTVWTWTLHRAYFHVIITFKYIVPKSEIKTVLYLNVKNCT